MHGESFCYLANFYRKILFVSLTDFPSFQFRREILAWGGEVVSCRRESELAEFYSEVVAYFKTPFPECAGVLPDAPEDTTQIVEGQSFLRPISTTTSIPAASSASRAASSKNARRPWRQRECAQRIPTAVP